MKHTPAIVSLVIVFGLSYAGLLKGVTSNQAEAMPSSPVQQVINQTNYNYLPCILNACEPLYFDNFSDPSSGWAKLDNPDELFEYKNGEYRILVRSTDWATGAHTTFQASDYFVSVDLRNPNNVWGSYGIGFGIMQNWSTLYTLEIYPDGWFGIYRVDPSSYVTLVEKYSPAVNQGSAINHIRLERNGASISAYANGKLLASVTDGTYTGTLYIGLVATSYEQANLDIRFDNFRVDSITCSYTESLENSSLNQTSSGPVLTREYSDHETNKHHP